MTTFVSQYLAKSGTTVNLPMPVQPITPLTTITVPNGSIVQGEAYIYNATGDFGAMLTADDCSSPCPAGSGPEPPIPLQTPIRDGSNRRGWFSYATFGLTHSQTTGLTSGQYSYIDLVKSQSPVSPLYDGIDPQVAPSNIYLTDKGDYGVPIMITGTNPNSSLKQRWDLEERGGPLSIAEDITGFVDSNGNSAKGSYTIPTTGALTALSQGGYLGTNLPGQARSMLLMPSGTDDLPFRLYYGLF